MNTPDSSKTTDETDEQSKPRMIPVPQMDPDVALFMQLLLSEAVDTQTLRRVELQIENWKNISVISQAVSLRKIADSLERLAGNPNGESPLHNAIYNAISTALFEDWQRRS